MFSQDGETNIVSLAPACACLTNRRWPSLEKDSARSNKCKGSSKQPGLDFLCPPVLVKLLALHWRDLQDGFSDSEELNKILVFQSDELRWTAQKREGMLRTLRFESLCSTVQLDGWRALLDGNIHLPGHEEKGKADVRSLRLYRAVALGDSRGLRTLLKRNYIDLDVFYNVNREELQWQANEATTFGPSGLWSLEYKRELTSPLCIAAAQGFNECLQYLLEHGAHPNLNAGGKAALHEACANGNAVCAELLLEHGANPNQLTEDGLTPLHLCRTPQSLRCAKAVVCHGAKVHLASEEEEETPLHVAARHGLPNHAQLYLRYGAHIDHTSCSGETPLGVACGEAQEKKNEGHEDRHLQLCCLLLTYGANVNLADKERRTPLHKAARNVQNSLVQLLLDYGADINAIDYNGCSPLSSVLQSSVVRQEWQPHIVVQTLLNHGSIKVWPQALLKVLTACAEAPKTVEILFNSYTLVPVTSKWGEAIPADIFQLHRPFYESLFALEYKPRCLQHLCRSALRKHFGKYCYLFIPRLPIPKMLQDYLLLEPEGCIN